MSGQGTLVLLHLTLAEEGEAEGQGSLCRTSTLAEGHRTLRAWRILEFSVNAFMAPYWECLTILPELQTINSLELLILPQSWFSFSPLHTDSCHWGPINPLVGPFRQNPF